MKVSDVLEKKHEGYKGFLLVEVPGFALSCAVKYSTMTSKDVKEAHKVQYKLDGQEVVRKYKGEGRKLRWCMKDNADLVVPEERIEEVQAFQVIKGKEEAVLPFSRSETIKVVKIVPREFKDNFLTERTLEVWSEDQGALYKLAEYLDTQKAVALCSITITKGFDTQFLGIIEPRFVENGKFGILMFLAKKKLIFNHLLDAAGLIKQAKPIGLEVLEGVI